MLSSLRNIHKFSKFFISNGIKCSCGASVTELGQLTDKSHFKNYPKSRTFNFYHKEKHKSQSVYLISSAVLGFSLLYYANKNKIEFFPSVDALSKPPGKRKECNFIADVVEHCVSGLVNIEVIDRRRMDFFTGQSITETNGSGFIVRDDGLIITNAHVVMSRRSNTKLKVTLYDGSTYEGVVEDIDMTADLATVRITANKKFPTMTLGSSQDVRVGEWVIAMGSPLSLANTITTGVISTAQRTSKDLRLYGKDMQYLQTDAMITFGNSGGPLVNLDGEVIGINAMKVTTGISFAIPVEYAKELLKISDKKRSGSAPKADSLGARRFIGITMLSLDPALIRELQLRKDALPPNVQGGVLVWKVMIGSPAFNAGLHPGDIVTEVNGQQINGASTIHSFLETGAELHMTVYRQGHKLKVSVIPDVF